MIKEKLDKETRYTIFGIIIFIIIYFGASYIQDAYLRGKPIKFCITTITKNGFTKNGKRIEHRYYILRNYYDDWYVGAADLKIKEGTRVLYGFLKEDHTWGKVYTDYIVPEHIQDSPPEGWTLEEVRKLDPSFATIELPYQ